MEEDLKPSRNGVAEDLTERLRRLPLTPGESEQALDYMASGAGLAHALLGLRPAWSARSALAPIAIAGAVLAGFAFMAEHPNPPQTAATVSPGGVTPATLETEVSTQEEDFADR
jgi:hypothetical protein